MFKIEQVDENGGGEERVQSSEVVLASSLKKRSGKVEILKPGKRVHVAREQVSPRHSVAVWTANVDERRSPACA